MDEETRDYYDRNDFGHDVGFGDKPALLSVDFMNAFTDPESKLGSDLDAEVEATAALLEAFRDNDLPVFHTVVEFEESSEDAGVFIEKIPALEALQTGSQAVETDERVAPDPAERVFVKKYASAFFGTDLVTALVDTNADTLVIAGVTTSGCVRATAIDSMQHGFRTLVPADAVGDRADPPHRANLFDIDAKYGDVVTSERVIQELESR